MFGRGEGGVTHLTYFHIDLLIDAVFSYFNSYELVKGRRIF